LKNSAAQAIGEQLVHDFLGEQSHAANTKMFEIVCFAIH